MKYNIASIRRMKDNQLKTDATIRLIEKKLHKQKPKVIKSLQDDTHLYYSESDYESWYEYGFFEADEMTDEEIQEYVDEMEIHIYSPYDCTGKVFTQWITWHRNPCGLISVVHKKSIDV